MDGNIDKKAEERMGDGTVRLTIIHDGKHTEIDSPTGITILEAVSRYTVHALPAPCGGKGRCGKCRVELSPGEAPEPAPEERSLLSGAEIGRGVRLACISRVMKPITVRLTGDHAGRKIGANFESIRMGEPTITKRYLELLPPTVEDQRSDAARLAAAAGEPCQAYPLGLLRVLPTVLRAADFKVTLVHDGTRAIAVEPGDTTEHMYGCAVDIGTTTVAVYLTDLRNGRVIDTISGLNAQMFAGADVISRISWAMTNPGGPAALRERIVGQIDRLVVACARENSIPVSSIYALSIAGNTTMIHLLLMLPSEHIAASPFTPVTTDPEVLPAGEIGFPSLLPQALVRILPSVSGYVGADITSAALAAGIHELAEPAVLIDIGTNGEILLGYRERILCCSTAAGPAFEGAHIRNGVGGVPGAINAFRVENGWPVYETIDERKPIGICGSGIVDVLAYLLSVGFVDETGRLLPPDEAPTDGATDTNGRRPSSRLITHDGEAAYLVALPEETASGEPILITQKDVREIQLAKAAIAAGIITLLAAAELPMEKVRTLFLAGGFGSFIDRESAVKIGLLPRELADRITVLGNAAGTGAVLALLSREGERECLLIRDRAEYLELSTSPAFQDAYVDQMFFPS